MNLYKNISIRNRLMLLFAVWMTVFIGFGVFAVVEVQNLADVAKDIYTYPLQISSAATEARVDIIKIHRGMEDLILIDDPAEIGRQEQELDKINNRVIKNLDIIKDNTQIGDTKVLEKGTRDLLEKWSQLRKQAVNLIISKDIKQALILIRTTSTDYVEQLENKLIRIDNNSKTNASMLLQKSRDIQEAQRVTLIISLFILGCVLFTVFIVTIRSILRPILNLQNVMKISANTGKLKEMSIDGRNEIVEMSGHYNMLIRRLKDIFWIKDCQNLLNNELRGSYSVSELCKRAVDFLSMTLDAVNGVLYLYDRDDKCLKLQSSFAYTERDVLSNKYKLGQGIVGQAGIERKPILLKDIKRENKSITTGTVNEASLNIYAFPLVYEDELYGVIALSSFEPFMGIKQDFLAEAANIISTSLYSSIQNQKITGLLEVSEISKRRAEDMAWELKNAIEELEEQQRILQRQSAELQQTNAELEEQQQVMRRQSEALESANKYKSEFLANMSHELRTPLNSFILLSRLLLHHQKDGHHQTDGHHQNSNLSQDQMDKVNIIYKSGQELLRLINDVLDLSKIESGSMTVNTMWLRTSDLSEELKKMFEDMAREKNLQLLIRDSIDDKIFGDGDKISQIIRNFLSNAIKFTEEGFVTLVIEHEGEQGAVFTVTDTGIGIPEDKIDIIFKEFEQVDGSISRKYGGTGLGLSISNKLAEVIGAKISVNSVPNEGSSFSLHIKNTAVKHCEGIESLESSMEAAACMDGEEKDVLDNAINYNCVKKNCDYGLNLNGKKILIVDDDPRNIFVLASALEDYEAEVLEAEDGQQALGLLKRQGVDLILMDIMMPVMDGYETIGAIRSDEGLKDIPIIALTAKALKTDKEKCITAGANDYISKPVDYEMLIRLVKTWINKQ